MADRTDQKQPYYKMIADRLIKQLEEGTAPWQKPWEPGLERLPHNPVSGTRYKGANALWLAMQGRSDPRWMTYKQAQKIGAQVQKGEKSVWVQYWKFTDQVPKKDEKGKILRDGKGRPITEEVVLDRPKVFSSRVFNAEQIKGLPPLEKKEPAWDRHERAERILAGSGAKILHDQADRAFYRPSTDSIHLPDHEQFKAADNYYATALHELGHWTGHGSRMGRDLSGGFGSESYAKEELRAEIASLMVGDELGTGHDPGQHAAYVKSWVKVLEEDPKEILRASRDAEKIMSLVMSYEKEKVRAADQAKEKPATEGSFDVVVGGNTFSFTDAIAAGAAFFHADRKERPVVVHEMEGNKGRIMAETAIFGTYSNSERRFVKTLPDSREVDADFRAGYFEALGKSVNERLKETDWGKAKPDHPAKAPNLDPEIYEDLAALAKADSGKAAKAWADHAPAEMTVPAFLDPDWKRQMAGAKETGQALDEAAQSGVLSRKLAEKVAENFPNEADRERFMAKVEDRISGNARRGNPDVKVREMLTGRDEPDQER
jgi:antirestriction protein ArdC